ncbi:MAG: hypothetical protein LBT16_10810 [Treponema sp.]|nr:hypothetical protein [Treponema sp.]
MEAIEFGTSAIDGVIEIPSEYRKDFSTGLRVILIKDVPHFAGSLVKPKQQNEGDPAECCHPLDGLARGSPPDSQERLAAAERLAGFSSKNPLSLEEIKNERLVRQ